MSKNKPAYYILWIEIDGELEPVKGATEEACHERARSLYGPDYKILEMQTNKQWLETPDPFPTWR